MGNVRHTYGFGGKDDQDRQEYSYFDDQDDLYDQDDRNSLPDEPELADSDGFDYSFDDWYDGLGPSTPRKKRSSRRWPWILASALVVLGLAGAIVYGVLRRHTDPEPTPTAPKVVIATRTPALSEAPAPGNTPTLTPMPPPPTTEPIALTSLQVYYQYDAAGNVRAKIAADGSMILYQYDVDGQLVRIVYPDGATVVYAYDSRGRRTEMTDAWGTTKYTYDIHDRLVSLSDAQKETIRYEYDVLGNVTGIQYPDGSRVEYTYNALDQLIGVIDGASTTTYRYDAAGRVIERSLPNGILTHYAYDASNHVIDITHTTPSRQVLLSLEYTLDAIGQRTQVTQTNSSGQALVTNYAYDSLGRLSQVNYPDGETVSYTYDRVGNRQSMTTSAGETTYEYNAENRLVLITHPNGDKTEFRYDDRGNLIQQRAPDRDVHYAYDHENQLVHYDDGHTRVEYAYDGDGNRVAKTVDGMQTTYTNHVDGPIPHVLTEDSAGTSIRYTGGHQLLSQIDLGTGTVLYPLKDALGSTIALADQESNLVASYQYDAFGAIRSSEGQSPSYGFAGERYDPESGLIYLRARYYDPALGRLMSIDPLPGTILNPQTQNGYTYANNNPVNLADPLGLQSSDEYTIPRGLRIDPAIDYWVQKREQAIAFARPGDPWIRTYAIVHAATLFELMRLQASSLQEFEQDINVAADPLASSEQRARALRGAILGAAWEIGPSLLPVNRAIKISFGKAKPGLSFPVIKRDRDMVVLLPGSKYYSIVANAIKVPFKFISQGLFGVKMGLQAWDAGISAIHEINSYLASPPVGGITLDQAAQVFTDLGSIDGAVYDESTGQLILVGQQNRELPPMDASDLLVAMRAIYQGTETEDGKILFESPGVSIDPLDPYHPEIHHPEMAVTYFGGVERTPLGQTLYEADRFLKVASLGTDNLTGEPYTSTVPGYKSKLELSAWSTEPTNCPEWHRTWFLIDQVRLLESGQGQGMIFDPSVRTIKAEARFVRWENGAKHDVECSDPAVDAFLAHLNEHYDEFAQEEPSLQRLEQLARIVAVVQWLKERGIPVDLSWLERYPMPTVETPTTTPALTAESSTRDSTLSQYGGVDLALTAGKNLIIEPRNPKAAQISNLALSSRPSDSSAHWTFRENGQTYTAVALNLAPSPMPGGYSFQQADIQLPMQGAWPLVLTRSYDSTSAILGPMGYGWQTTPFELHNYRPGDQVTLVDPSGSRVTFDLSRYITDPQLGQVFLPKGTPGGYYGLTELFDDASQIVGLRAWTWERHVLSFDLAGRLRALADNSGNAILYQYDQDARLTHITDTAQKNSLSFQYDENGLITRVTGSDDRTTRYAYDRDNHLIRVTLPDGRQVTYSYDADHHLTGIEIDGQTLTQNQYDSLGRLIRQTDGAGNTTTASYDRRQGLVSVRRPDGYELMQYYDAQGHLSTQIEPNGQVTSYEYDSKGNVQRMMDATQVFAQFEYDDRSRLIAISDASGQRTEIRYDVIDQDGNPVEYVVSPDGQVTEYTFDARGNLRMVEEGLYLDGTQMYIDPRNNRAVAFDYDESGNLARQYWLHTGSTNQLSALRPPLDYTYDDAGRLTKAAVEGHTLVQQQYDERGLLASVSDALGHKTSFGYDDQGRLTSISTPTEQVSITRDDSQLQMTIVDALGHQTLYLFDAADHLTAVVEPDGSRTAYEYDARGNRVRTRHANGEVTTQIYDNADNPIAVVRGNWPETHILGEVANRSLLPPMEKALNELPITPAQIVVEPDTMSALARTEQGALVFVSWKTGSVTTQDLGDPNVELEAADLEHIQRTLSAIDGGAPAIGVLKLAAKPEPDAAPDILWVGPEMQIVKLPSQLARLAKDWPDRATGDPDAFEAWQQDNQKSIDELGVFIAQLIGSQTSEYVVQQEQTVDEALADAYGLGPELYTDSLYGPLLETLKQANGLSEVSTLPTGTVIRVQAANLGEMDGGWLYPIPQGQHLFLNASRRQEDMLNYYFGASRTIFLSRGSTVEQVKEKLAQEEPIALGNIRVLFSAHSEVSSEIAEQQKKEAAQLAVDYPGLQLIDVTGDPEGRDKCLDEIANENVTVLNIAHTTPNGKIQVRDDGSFSAREVNLAQRSVAYLNCSSAQYSFGDATIQAGARNTVETTKQITLSANISLIDEILRILEYHKGSITFTEAFYRAKLRLRLRGIRGYTERAMYHDGPHLGAENALPQL